MILVEAPIGTTARAPFPSFEHKCRGLRTSLNQLIEYKFSIAFNAKIGMFVWVLPLLNPLQNKLTRMEF